MNYEIHITKTAEKDLANAVDYIELVLYNPQAADNLLAEFEKKAASLSQFPQKFSLVDDPLLKAWGIRFTAVKNHLVFYTISEPKKRVNILRFLYEKRNWMTILKQEGSIL